MPKAIKIGIAVIVGVGALFVLGPWVYINLVKRDAPQELSMEPQVTEPTNLAPTNDQLEIDGAWRTTKESVVGYRVNEILFGQQSEAVGRSSEVVGQIEILDSVVVSGGFRVPIGSIRSDSARRDSQFDSRIMEATRFPTAEFVLTGPIEIGETQSLGELSTVQATGDLTLHGITKPVSIALDVQLANSLVTVVGTIPIVFEEWGIPYPGNQFVTTDDHGVIEFKLVLGQ